MSIRRVVIVLLAAGLAVAAASAPVGTAGAAPSGPFVGKHSLRAPVTDETFYFVMADRFANGSTGNDTGGISGDHLSTALIPLTGASTKAAISRACWTGSITYRA